MLPAGVCPSPKTKGPPLRASSSTSHARPLGATAVRARHSRRGWGIRPIGGNWNPVALVRLPATSLPSPPLHSRPPASPLVRSGRRPRGRDAAAAGADDGLGRRNHLWADPKGSSIVICDWTLFTLAARMVLELRIIDTFPQCWTHCASLPCLPRKHYSPFRVNLAIITQKTLRCERLNAHNLAIACSFFAVRALLSLDSVFLSYYQIDICSSGRTCPVGERDGLTRETSLSIVERRVLIRCIPNRTVCRPSSVIGLGTTGEAWFWVDSMGGAVRGIQFNPCSWHTPIGMTCSLY
jgi:hypothetical protein